MFSCIQQLLKGQSKLKRLMSSDKLSEGLDLPPSLEIQNKKQSSSVNVDCRDESGATALMLAILNGHKDVVYTLLQYSAELFVMDNQGYANNSIIITSNSIWKFILILNVSFAWCF